MTLVMFAVVVVLVAAAWYLISYLFTLPRPVQIVVNVVAGLVIFFCALALFHLMPLPFDLK